MATSDKSTTTTFSDHKSIVSLQDLIDAEIHRIRDAQERVLADFKSVTGSVDKPSAEASTGASGLAAVKNEYKDLEQKLTDLHRVHASVESLIESASFIINSLERLRVRMEAVQMSSRL